MDFLPGGGRGRPLVAQPTPWETFFFSFECKDLFRVLMISAIALCK